MQSLIPPSFRLRQKRESTWRELDYLVNKAENGSLKSLTPRELTRLPILHRLTVSSLAAARSLSLNQNLLDYLENLTARSHVCLNTNRPKLLPALQRFFGQHFPHLVRRYALQLLFSTLIFAAGALTAFTLTLDNSERFYSFIDPAMAQGRNPDATDQELRSVLFDSADADELSVFAASLFDNNTRVGILCFALGFAFGIPVIYLLFTNGMIIGAMAALYHSRGLSYEFWSWILPHGIPEILAILLCGAAGLAMAKAVIFPGRFTRLRNLSVIGREAGAIVGGTVGLFFIAALIEGFFRQLVQDPVIRYGVASLGMLLLVSYFVAVGRMRRKEQRR